MTTITQQLHHASAFAPAGSRAAQRTATTVTVLVTLFLVFDGVTKVLRVPQVLDAFARIHFPPQDAVGIGVLLLSCLALYLVPRTAVLGALLLTAYLGGAVATNVHAGQPAFNTAFPAIFGGLVWLPLYLREPRLRALIPFRGA